jgi:hypothetical protein
MRRLAPLVVAAGPPVIAFALVAAFMTAEAFGFRPFNAEPANISEAAARGAAATALRFIASGADPNVPWPIAEGVLGTLPRTVNAIDAAILGRRAEMISLLHEHGATTDAHRATCLAEAIDFPDALPALGLPAIADEKNDPRQVGDPVGTCLSISGTN